MAKPFYRRRALNVFRDKTGLAAGPALWRTIEAALERSGHFILLASPESAHSEWVEKEVGWWLRHRGPTGTAATIFAVLALVAWHERGVAVDKPSRPSQASQAERNADIAATRQRLAEQRLKQLCDAWNVAVAYVVKNVDPGAIYDIKAELYSVFPFDDNCP